MFKKLKEKITEEVKSSPQRLQQFTQSVSDRLQNSSTSDDNFFSIGDDDANMSSASIEPGFSSVALTSSNDINRVRRSSNSSLASDVSFLPRYEFSSNMYQLQSDLDISASEIEDNGSSSSQLGHLSKEQIYSAFQKAQMRYHKYRGRYTDLARHYKDLERDNAKMKSVLVETQDKAIRRVTELKEQCTLEQKAKAHLEGALRDELDEKQFKIQTLETKITLLQGGESNLVSIDNAEGENMEMLTKYLNDARKEIENLNTKLQEYKANSIVFQSKEQEYKNRISGLEKEVAQFPEREKENNLKIAQSKMELHNELLSKEAEIINMKKDNEVLRQSLEAYEIETKTSTSTKMENLQSQNTKLIERVEYLTQKCNNLESDLLKVEQYKIEIAKLKDEIKLVNEKNKQLEPENSKLQSDVATLRKGLETCREKLKQLAEEKLRLSENISKEKSDYENQIANLREDAKQALLSIESKIRAKIESEFSEKETQLKHDFRQKLDEVSSTENNLKELQLKLFEKSDLVQTLTQALNELKDELSGKDESYKELEKNHLELIEDSSQLRNKISGLEKEVANIQNAEDKITRLQAGISTLQEELTTATKLCEVKEDEIVRLSTDFLNIEQALAQVQQKVRLFEEKEEVGELNDTECKLLEMKLQKLEEEKRNLLEKFEEERKVFDEMIHNNKELQEKEAHLNRLQIDYNQLQPKIEELQHKLAIEVEDNKEINEKKLLLERENAKLHETVKLYEEKHEVIELDKNECKILELKLQSLEQEQGRLLQSFEYERGEFDKTSLQHECDKQLLVEKSEKYQQEVKVGKKRISDLRNELEKVNSENALLQNELQNRDHQISSLSQRIDDCKTVIENQSRDFNNLLQRSNQLDEIVAKIQEESSESVKREIEKQNELMAKMQECEKELQEKCTQLEQLKRKFDEFELAYNANEESLNMHKEEVARLQSRLVELQAVEESYQVLGSEKQTVEEELVRLKIIENDYNNLKNNNLQLEGKLEELQKELVDKKAQVENFVLRNSEMDEELRKTREECVYLNQQYQELRSLNANLTAKLGEAKETAASLNVENATLQNRCEQLTNEISELTIRIKQISSDNNHISDENQNLLESVESWKLKCDLLEKETGDFAAVRAKLEQEKTSLSKAVDDATLELQQLQKLNLDVMESRNTSCSNETDVEQVQKNYYELKEKHDKLVIENKNLTAEFSKLEGNCSEFDKLRKNFEAQITELEHQYNEIAHEKQLLQDEVQELKITPINFQNKLDNLQIIKQEKVFNTESTNNNSEFLREIDSLREKLTQYKSLDITNKTSIEFYENELQKLKNKNEKLNRKLDETLVTLNHCADLSSSTEIEYLKNVLYNYMLGKESLVLARVIAAVCKFDPQQTETVLQKEQQKQTLLGQLGIL